MLLYHTEMRLGEMLGLSWGDIDFDAKKINLWRQIHYIKKRGCFFTTLKTESSNRYILVADFLLRELKRWQARQAENEAVHGDSYVYIYRDADGHIEKLNAHSFRHTQATILAENGAHPKGVAGRPAHSKINITHDLHVHATQKIQEGFAVIFDKNLQTK